MTKKIYNDGVKIIGLALRSMIKVKEAQRSENEAVEMYWKKEGCSWFPPSKRTGDQIDILQNILHNIDGCQELLPLFNQATDQNGNGPINVGSSEERTGLLKQIADLESKLDQADKSFAAQGERFQKAWDDMQRDYNFKLGENTIEIDKLSQRIKVLESTGPKWGEMTYEAVCQENKQLRNELASLADSIDGSEHIRNDLQNANRLLSIELAKQIDGSKELLLVNEKLNERCAAFGVVNSQLSTTNVQRAEQIDGLQRRIEHDTKEREEIVERWKQRLAENERHLNSSIREEGITKRALNRANDTIDALIKTNKKVCDERDGLRKELEQRSKLHVSDQPVEPPKHWDCIKSSVAAAAMERATQATPVDTGAVKEDVLRLRVVLDTSDVSSKFEKLNNAFKD